MPYMRTLILNDQGGDVMNVSDSVTSTLRAQDHGHPPVVCMREAMNSETCYAIEWNVVDRVSAKNGKGWCENVSPTLNTQDRHAVVFAKVRVYAVENHPNDSRARIDPDGIVQTLSSRMGTGGNNTPFVLIAGDNE